MRAPQGLSEYAAPPARFAKTKGLLAGALLGVAGALAAWAYQSLDGPEPEATTASTLPLAERGNTEPAPAATVSSSPAPHATTRPVPDDEQLPVLNTDDLPKAPDELPLEEVEEEAQSAAAALAVVPAPTVGSAPAQNADGERTPASVAHGAVQNSATPNAATPIAATQTWATDVGATGTEATQPAVPAAGTSHASAQGLTGVPKRAAPSAVAARRETPRRAKPASSADDCNPPYFFDEHNIKRLKLECL